MPFGQPVPNIAGPKQPMVDEIALGTDPALPNPPPVASFAVDQPAADIVRTHPATGSLLMAGDADGLVDAAALGLLDGPQADFFSASYATDPTGFDHDLRRPTPTWWSPTPTASGPSAGARSASRPATPSGPTRWRPTTRPTSASRSSRTRPAADQTVTEQLGGATVTATDYGNPVTYTPDDRPANAMDGDPQSAWRVGALADPTGEQLDHRPSTTR